MVSTQLLSAVAATLLALPGMSYAAAVNMTNSTGVCHQAPYQQFLPLSTFYLAEVYCASKFPESTAYCAATKTEVSTSTKIDFVATITHAAHYKNVTTGGAQTVTITSTITPNATATTTDVSTIFDKRAVETAAAHSSSMLALYSSFVQPQVLFNTEGFYRTVCSCNNPSPACKTKTATSTSVVTVKRTSELYPTYTSSVNNTMVVTKYANATAPASTSTVTAYETVSA